MFNSSFLRLLLAFAICATLLTPPLQAFNQGSATDQSRFLEIKILSTNILSVAKILRREGVAIEPGLLFTPIGRNSVRSQLSSYSDMNVSKVVPKALGGIWMADQLTLSESSQLEADTLIIANHVIFSGDAPSINGPYDFHLFALDSISVNDPETVITIDTSGLPGTDGVAGTAGQSGQTGATGARGKEASCSAVAGVGEPGTDGTQGEDGGPGTYGTNGTNAGNQTIMFDGASSGLFKLIANGGNGGNGGAGGFGGDGGNGGNGGSGSDGPGCNCDMSAIGDGGIGGPAGRGGLAGTGGQGGKGGNGGNAGTIVFTHPSTYNNGKLSITARGGSGGQAGIGGSAGVGGAAGNPGAGGRACDKGRNGRSGPAASGSAGRNGGAPGEPGRPGQSGSIAQNVADFKNGRGRINWSYEPGATRESCTEWFSGSTMIGCY